MDRVVTVKRTGKDRGFQSRFGLRSSYGFGDHDYFIPAIWYGENSKARPGALGTDPTDDYFIIREDRMPLPLVMMRNLNNGVALSLIHLEPDGSTCSADYAAERVIDRRIQVASLGIYGQEKTAVGIYYPAAEGERSYVRSPGGRRNSRHRKRWVDRFHPVQDGLTQHYKVLIKLDHSTGFPQAMRTAWRTAFDNIHPPVAVSDVAATCEASIRLISAWVKTMNGVPGLPFKLRLPKGTLEKPADYSYQMGFVGQQVPLAYHLLRYGLRNNDPDMVAKGASIVDFWASHALTAQGLPRTWFDPYPQPHWRRYDTYLRVASDGMVGALMAWNTMKKKGRERPDWIRFCTRFGDWLVKNQNEDGSWYRAYRWDGTVAKYGKSNTSNPIRFLVDLYYVTGDERYWQAARKAGKYCWETVHKGFDYVGGTADNPNVLDKEAGFMAIDAFLALWDATGDRKYLQAAAQAADFTETWQYCWQVPLPADNPEIIFPRWVPTTGFGIIATGHSGADLFLTGAPFLFYRIYLGTGDAHYAAMARQLLYDPRNHVDVNGSLGYGQPGLCTEAITLSVDGKRGRGSGVDVWLPWLSYNMLEPVVQLRAAYGMIDTPVLSGATLRETQRKDHVFAQTRGLLKN